MIVVDASVALKWVLTEPDSDAAIALRNDELTAPDLWLAEAANGLWRHMRLGEIATAQALQFLRDLIDAPVTSVPTRLHLSTALRLAIELRHPIYDCLYPAVALRFDTHVVTADRRFAATAAAQYPGRVRLLASE
ncbi:MAG: type II toxin-antitoxin system VapC family toxin [Alphaproteobacteria bacterium]